MVLTFVNRENFYGKINILPRFYVPERFTVDFHISNTRNSRQIMANGGRKSAASGNEKLSHSRWLIDLWLTTVYRNFLACVALCPFHPFPVSSNKMPQKFGAAYQCPIVRWKPDLPATTWKSDTSRTLVSSNGWRNSGVNWWLAISFN